MEEKILDFIMEYAQENEGVPFQVIEENFNIVMDDKLKDIISDAIWDRDNVSDVIMENDRYVITCFEDQYRDVCDRYGNEIKKSDMRRMHIRHSPFFINLLKKSKRIEVPQKE